MITKVLSLRGRPRGFEIETALETGQRLFHARGYNAVGLAALTEALGIKPTSFYRTFGSKAGYFARILERYSQSVLALEDILRPGRSAAEALADLLERAAQTYARDPQQRGCLVLEAARGGDDDESANLARRSAQHKRSHIRVFVALSNPDAADAVTDFVASTMSGLSASAREGMSEDRVVAVARAAARALPILLIENSPMGQQPSANEMGGVAATRRI
ncbi:TetR/AcrR family transcriptional regulator [Tardiphaga sp. vice352]|uniref:TetR/AcrR family transcriptional regulator n=1 Tax=unclassified Tardiphaga TaxID=2631404 RepID=UPI0011659953|nr:MULTISPECIES: TetR/AcrR family transcriptional regulator [unclassified Tardiphaga]MBC7585870.1 TetR/AcrR family transcriptional regulator [Tardiphaga sp.]QDM16968.1 TetR/AcrR family transcriptional regulator [Tardiphaga sp. vice278]QDM21950.1 TetR/AcrR family transcriptional regulator [Tardiphaga sp. vice154]QDM27204.1 TetR/AcrR family transcriptional regulator [Tardiphaga sp. vice304]QDM32329.1 TetR/AcrR family transcriptional regulator [Tardiphaga sp. vice352]